VKICGITRPADVIAAVDAIGLNFVPTSPSPRSEINPR
jgi:phosphoribosylanthranilate isomerase